MSINKLVPMPDRDRITSVEANNLIRLLNARAKVTRHQIEATQAAHLAAFEKQLAAVYDAHDKKWEELTAEMEETGERMNKELRKRCKADGILFPPQWENRWYPRGESISSSRRAELRKVAMTSLEARAKQAKVEVDRTVAELLGQITLRTLRSEESKDLLDKMPTIEALMPTLSLAEVERKLPCKMTMMMNSEEPRDEVDPLLSVESTKKRAKFS